MFILGWKCPTKYISYNKKQIHLLIYSLNILAAVICKFKFILVADKTHNRLFLVTGYTVIKIMHVVHNVCSRSVLWKQNLACTARLAFEGPVLRKILSTNVFFFLAMTCFSRLSINFLQLTAPRIIKRGESAYLLQNRVKTALHVFTPRCEPASLGLFFFHFPTCGRCNKRSVLAGG